MSTASAPASGGTLGRRLLITVALHSTVVALAGVAMFAVQRGVESDLERAMAEFVEEHWIADRLSAAVMSELAAASAYVHRPDPVLLDAFRRAGEEVYREVRQYLQHDLTPEQRLQVELVLEQHQRLEVAAARSLELAAAGREREAVQAGRVLAEHGVAFQTAINAFLALREAEVDQVRASQDRTFRYLYIMGGLIGLLLVGTSLMLGHVLDRRLARPLAELSDGARRIGEGDLSVRVRVPEERELAALAGSFNQMAGRLVQARMDLQERNEELEDALDRLQKTQGEMVHTEKMSATGRMMAGLAHELNNPLASVLGYSQLLAARLDEADDGEAIAVPELRELSDPIVSEASRAREIVRNLLRFTRKSEVASGPVSLVDTVQLVVGLRSYTFAQAGVALEVGEVPDAHVRGDPQRLQQVLLNLVNNAFDAVRGEKEGGTVRVSVERDDGMVVVVVEDDGPGFADPDRIFEPFYTTKPVGEGTGLGLTLVHQFVQEAGGAVQAGNRPEGGARVVLRLRECPPPRPAIPAVPEDGAPTAGSPFDDRVVLVVEDEAPLRTLQTRLLSRAGATVRAAAGGHHARAILESTDVDLVISDVKMPDGSGLELYHWVLQNRPALADRFIFVTGDVGDPEISALARTHPHQFISKPFHADDYLAGVSTLLGRWPGGPADP